MAAGHSIDAVRWPAISDQAMARIAGRFKRVEPRTTAWHRQSAGAGARGPGYDDWAFIR
ncbi:hypothetical protein ACWIG3_26730 [Streptomyces celluloflavus]